ncbi:hypothetical protein [Desulfobacter postgatei]|jgi:hypothetical protein|uniref:hypothetical protein n=1 Tax=Desulfobacter postgatei TaxID=2293 RepID=UPI002A3664B6|nr:hypothetical protein [Desulfobacter postgatei]MDX9964258.1 hypothetical protein [Desulfobacter postgatei]
MKQEKNEKNLPVKKITQQEAKEIFLEYSKVFADPEIMLKDFILKYMPQLCSKEAGTEEAIKIMSDLSLALSIETGFMLMKSVDKQYNSLALQIRRDLQEEFACKTASEKMLVDLAVNSFIRNLCYSDKMGQTQEYIGNEYNNYRNYFSKEIDRAHRQFISAIETLKFIKQPSMKVNIKTNNAFVGENQQFNNNQKK